MKNVKMFLRAGFIKPKVLRFNQIYDKKHKPCNKGKKLLVLNISSTLKWLTHLNTDIYGIAVYTVSPNCVTVCTVTTVTTILLIQLLKYSYYSYYSIVTTVTTV